MNGKLDSFILGILFTVSLQLYMRNKSYFNLIICILLILYAIRQNALQCIYELTNKILDMQVKDKYLNPIVVDIN